MTNPFFRTVISAGEPARLSNSVRVGPGQSAVTEMPVPAHSLDRASENDSM